MLRNLDGSFYYLCMNIIKFTDSVIEGHEWYNSHLRGKYAYWVHCKYAVPLDSISQSIYISLEKETDENIVLYLRTEGIDVITSDDAWVSIDGTAMEVVNNIDVYLTANKFVAKDNIPLDDLKKFRTWLATNLLNYINSFKSNLEYSKYWSESFEHVLQYYVDGMVDDTVRWLNEFGGVSINITNPSINTCGCVGGGTNLSSLYNEKLSVCDSISIYKENVKQYMVSMLSNVDLWVDLNKVDDKFLPEIIKYLNGIITENLPLVQSTSTLSDTFSCKCLSTPGAGQVQAQAVLQNVIGVFDLIINHTTNASLPKLSASSILSTWLSTLYENMEWS